jgi:hypothetical protein
MKNSSHFVYKTIPVPALTPVRHDFEGEFITIYSVTGTVEIGFNGNNDYVPVFAGMQLRYRQGERFDEIYLRSAAGGSINLYFGLGSITSSGSTGGGGGSAQVYNGAVDDPNGTIVPIVLTSPAVYIKDQATPVVMWIWSVTNQNWFAAIN